MASPRKRRRQPPVKGGRHTLLAGLDPELAAMVQHDADTSVPPVYVGWILSDAVAKYYQMYNLSPFRQARDVKRRTR